MISHQDEQILQNRFTAQVCEAFQEALGMAEDAGLTVSEIEASIATLKYRLANLVVESALDLRTRQTLGKSPVCEDCGREMLYQGPRDRRVITAQGEIILRRPYYYCCVCESGHFHSTEQTEPHYKMAISTREMVSV